jgi:RNA-directed DNA polymerase
MTAVQAGAPSTYGQNWDHVKWSIVRTFVFRMQMRIAKSIREERWGKAKALQHLLSRSWYGRLWAVKRITANKGSRTPGIDRVTWNSSAQRWKAALNLNVRGYKALPLRRIYIPKKNGKRRPLGIPTLHDRAMQELFALGLRPIAETVGDSHSYGFREKRSLHDAVKMTYMSLSTKVSAKWILEADIKACFDCISHDWLMENIPLPKWILRQWLKCGYMESSALYPTDDGTPQGGIISPILCNMTLDGLQDLVIKGRDKKRRKLNIIRYADDFIITGATPEILLNEIKPDLVRFLAERGLSLSEEKTKLSHINDGFNFLGFNVRKYKQKLLIKPQDGKVRDLLDKVKTFLASHRGIPFHVLLIKLNRIVRGWAYAYRRVVAKERMGFVDYRLYYLVRNWLRREHRSKTFAWIAKRHRRHDLGRWDFAAIYFTASGDRRLVRLFRAAYLPIRYHTKIRSEANPYDPSFDEYFASRNLKRKLSAMSDRVHMNADSYHRMVA